MQLRSKAKSPLRQRAFVAVCQREILERAKGFEPSTPTLARSCSTTELHPHPRGWQRSLAGNGQSYAKCGPRMQQRRAGAGIGRMAGIAGDPWPNQAKSLLTGVPAIANWTFRGQLGL